jgi:L-ascorbate metabolism protein UlaG (beta-lactamase superfamily)
VRITICGHAGLWAETTDQQILVDPVFASRLAGGAVAYVPRRALRASRLPRPTLLVVTHGHFDHCHPDSLRRLPRDLPVVAPADRELLAELRALGFDRITTLRPWQRIRVGQTELQATPSDHDEPEFGLVIRDASASFWHMADAEVVPAVGERVLDDHGPIDVVATKYQPVVQSSIGYLRGLGIGVAKRAVFEWLETACVCRPRLVFPYASGVGFRGRHAWFNRYAFALSAEEAARLLQARLGGAGRAGTVQPGDVIEAADTAVRLLPQAAPFVRTRPTAPARWEPIDTRTLPGLRAAAQRRELQERLEALLCGRLADWLEAALAPGGACAAFVDYAVVWQLVVHAGGGERLAYAIDFRQPVPALLRGEHPHANYFVHVAGRTLYGVLRGEAPERLFWLAGDARIYEKILGVRDGRFWQPPEDGWDLFERLPDPVTYYLRHHAVASGPEPEARLWEPPGSPPRV